MSDRRANVLDVVRRRGLRHFEEPVQLSSGELSHDFVDVKAALADGDDLRTACETIVELVGDIAFDAVGGLTMGADQFAHGVAMIAGCDWFVVRKEPKNRGTNQLVEGSTIVPGTRVLLVDDAVTTGTSIQKAYAVVRELGAAVVAASTMVDRGDVAAVFFADQAVPYFPVLTYRDLGIEPVGTPAAA